MNTKKNNTILIILLITFILSTLSLGGYIIYDKSTTKTDNKNNEITNNDSNTSNENIENNQEEKNYLIIPIVKDIVNFLSENSIPSFIKFESPEKVLNDNTGYLSYLLQTSGYTSNAPEGYMNHFSITIENVKKYLKEIFNYDYSNDEIIKSIGEYDEITKSLIIPSSGGIIPPMIESIYEINGKYYVNIYSQSDTIKKGTIVLKQENNQFYFYSSTGLN